MFGPDPRVKYEIVHDPDWETAVRSWAWEEVDNGHWKIRGNCPRCGHSMSMTYRENRPFVGFLARVGERTKSLLNLFGGANQTKPLVFVDLRCNCMEEHPPKEAGSGAGCGRYGQVPSPLAATASVDKSVK